MKDLLVVLAVFGAALVFQLAPAQGGQWPDSCGNNKTHNFNFGRMTSWDRLLYVNHTVRPSKFLRKLSFDVTIPPKGTYPRGTISYIQVLDQNRDGNGGCAYLKSGGPGYLNTTLHIKSQRNKGVNFIINVYGH